MISFYKDDAYNLMRLHLLQGKVSSIWKHNSLFRGERSYPVMPFTALMSKFVDFEKHINDRFKMNYHLSGYGTSFDEALRGFLGESAERYSFAVLSQLISERIITASYSSLLEKYGAHKVFPLEVINAYCGPDKENSVDEADAIRWVRMNSLVDPSQAFYAPLQFVLAGAELVYPEKKTYVPSAVSTGTASHETVLQALDSALIECLQIDSFELWWYGGLQATPVELDQYAFLKTYFDDSSVNTFLEHFSLTFLDISFDKNIYVYVCEIVGKKPGLPKYTVGVQGGYDSQKALYRGLMEALCVLEYNMNLPWMDYSKWLDIDSQTQGIDNFDNNVIKYAKYGKPHLNTKQSSLTPHKQEGSALSYVRKHHPCSGYLVITAPDFEDFNLEVVRVCIPDLLPLSLPSYPPQYHPRFLSNEGIGNYVAHPLA